MSTEDNEKTYTFVGQPMSVADLGRLLLNRSKAQREEGQTEKDKIRELLSLMRAHTQDIRNLQVQHTHKTEEKKEADFSWAQFEAEYQALWNLLISEDE